MYDTIFTFLFFFGSILCPPVMLLARKVRQRWILLVLLLALHVLLIGVVMLAVWLIRMHGYRDWIYAMYYHVVVNAVMAVLYAGFVLFASRRG